MKSEFKISTPSIKGKIVIGFFACVLIIVLAAMFRVEFGLILLGVAGFVITSGCVFVIGVTQTLLHKGRLNWIEEQKQTQELRLLTYQANKAKLEAFVLSFPKTQRLVTLPDSSVRVIEAIAEPAQAMLPPSTESINLLSSLDSVQRCLIVGASDSGKTTLLQHIITRRLASSKVIVIDPHSYPGKFPNGCKVIGSGRNYDEIDKALSALVQLMTRRYKEIGSGLVAEMAHGKVTILIDEWRAIVQNVKGSGAVITALLTESRKASFSVFVATHSERVKALGIEGEGDLKDGFAVVRLSILNGERQATIDYGNGKQSALLPGAYAGNGQQVIDSDDYINLEVEPDATEAQVLEMLERDESYKTITESVWGIGKYGDFYNRKVDAIKAKFMG